jgi:type II secretory pathway component PulF
MYPILLVGIALAAVLSLFLLVLPNIFSIAEQFNVSDLPTTTRILKQFSDFLMVYRPYIL